MSRELAEKIIGAVGGRPNILRSSQCMTRLRLALKDEAAVDRDALNRISGILGVVSTAEQLQIVLGPGKVKAVAAEVDAALKLPLPNGSEYPKRLSSDASAKTQAPVKMFLGRLSAVFVPLIPAIVASGMIAGLTNLAIRLGVDSGYGIIQILNVTGWAIFGFLPVFVGFQVAKEFGGTTSLGAMAGVLLINPAIASVQIDGAALLPGRGGVFGVLLVAGLMVWLEKKIRRKVPQTVDIIVTPTLTLLIAGILTYYVLQPVGGILSEGVVRSFRTALSSGGLLAGAVLAGTFLPLVMTGLHQGLAPVHMEFLNTVRANPLLPVLAMAGAGQVGAAIAVLCKTKNERLRRIIKNALPVGFLGIGEPLIFGVTLPLGRPFVTACIGAAAGGAFQAFMSVQSIAMGVSGLPLAFLIRGDQIAYYLGGLCIAYVAGFLATYFSGFEDPANETGNGDD